MPICGGELTAGTYEVITVEDSGCGMDEETLSRAFEPFFSTKAPDEGTGLGLSTIYAILGNWGGGIQVESEPGRGTVLRVLVPRSSGAAPDRDVHHVPSARSGSVGGETVLMVEDEPAVRRLAVRALSDQGYSVLKAGAAAESIRIMEEAAARVSLVITDMLMPGMGGGELADILQAAHPDLKVLLTSGYSAASHHGGTTESPERPFLEKPVTPHEPVARVRQLLDSA